MATNQNFTEKARQAIVAGQQLTEQHTLAQYEPEALLGGDTAPNAVETVLAGLASCLAVGYAYNAAAQGIELQDVTFTAVVRCVGPHTLWPLRDHRAANSPTSPAARIGEGRPYGPTVSRTALSRFAEVADQADAGRIIRGEVGLHLVQQRCGGGLQPRHVVPESMTGELLLQKPPHPFHQVQGRRVGRLPEWGDTALLCGPPRPHRRCPVVADIIHDQDQLVFGPRRGDLGQKGGKRIATFLRMELPGHHAGPVVHRPEHGPALVLARRRDPQRTSPALPDLHQVGMGVEVTFIHVEKPESSPGSSPLFWSSARTCLAEATASAS